MGSRRHDEGEIKDSEVKEYKEVSYKLFQHGDVRSSSSINGGFCCPLCDDQQNYDYTRLLRHAIQTAEGSSSSGKQRAKHAAMARYLAVDFPEEDLHSSDLDDGPFIKRLKTKNNLNSKAAG